MAFTGVAAPVAFTGVAAPVAFTGVATPAAFTGVAAPVSPAGVASSVSGAAAVSFRSWSGLKGLDLAARASLPRRLERHARATEVSMKIQATTQVNLLRKVPAPRPPKTA